MMDASRRLTVGICPTAGCGQRIRLSIGGYREAVDACGGLVIECSKCLGKSHVVVCDAVDLSRIESGGRILATWDDSIAGNRAAVFAAHGLSEPDALRDTMTVIGAKGADDPLFDLTERAIYRCETCGANLEKAAYEALDRALDAINHAIARTMAMSGKEGVGQPEAVEVVLAAPCSCGTHRLSCFRAWSDKKQSADSASEFILAGPEDASMLTHIDGVYSRNDCVEMFKKILRRWKARNRIVTLVVPFIGFDFPNREDDKLKLWNMVLGHTDPGRTILITRKATYTSFKRAARNQGLDLDLLKKYGLLAHLLDQLDTKGALFKTEFHAKFYAAMGPETTEVLSGSFNIHSGEYIENLLFKTYPNAEFIQRYLIPLGVVYDFTRARAERDLLTIDVSEDQVLGAKWIKRM